MLNDDTGLTENATIGVKQIIPRICDVEDEIPRNYTCFALLERCRKLSPRSSRPSRRKRELPLGFLRQSETRRKTNFTSVRRATPILLSDNPPVIG